MSRPVTVTVQPGQRFGRLTVTDPEVRLPPRGVRAARCRCDCGNVLDVRLSDLTRTGKRTAWSCGCWKGDLSAIRNQQHGTAMNHADFVSAVWRLLGPQADPDHVNAILAAPLTEADYARVLKAVEDGIRVARMMAEAAAGQERAHAAVYGGRS